MTIRSWILMAAVLPVAFLASEWAPGLWAQQPSGSQAKGTAKATTSKTDPATKSGTPGKKSAKPPTENPFPKRFPSPNLDGGTSWLNTSGPITLQDLRGKVVLLDFWTYCCINCMHILPDLAFLEQKYPNELVVIGVHSGKFNNEKDTENIRQAILRYEIAHPVLNDPNMKLWEKFQINTWPSFVLIDPEGNFCGTLAGEGNRERLDLVISRVVDFHRSKGTLDETPIRFDLESRNSEPTPLRFPGKILADEAGQRLFISDSNHNRIVVTDLTGKLLYVIGSGAIGKVDGPLAAAQFDHPQGMDLDGNLLYVADTENHSIRVVDLVKKEVKTLAGTGKQARQHVQSGKPLTTALASPWDVKKVGDKLFIAMAGFHQIWVMTGPDSIRNFAGTGREDVTNGPLPRSAFAQPSGMTTDGTSLFVVDSEGSAVRKLPVNGAGSVSTLVGTSELPAGRSLFAFGDIDGVGNQARLQHPLGIVHRKGLLYVADTYNHKIKVIDIAQRTSKTLIGSTQNGPMTQPGELSEPAGVSIAGDKLYIADTNNHRIRVYDFNTKQLTNLEIAGLKPPPPPPVTDNLASGTNVTKVPAQEVAAGDQLRFQVELAIPDGFKVNRLAPVVFLLKAEGNQPLIAKENLNERDEAVANDKQVTIQIPLAAKSGSGQFQLTVIYSYCRDGNGGACKFKQATWSIPISVSDKSTQQAVALQFEE